LSDTSVLDALRFVTRSNRHFYVVRGSQSVLIAPDTRQKRQEHMPQGMRTFQLDHADPRTVITVLRSLLQTRNLVHDDRLNTVTMKDTVGQLDIAEEIIDRLDRESDEAPDIRAVDREPFWVGTEFSQDLRSRGDSIPRLELDMEQAVTLDLDNSTVRQVFETLGNVAGIQFVFALEIDLSQPASFALSKMSVQEALDTVNQRLGNFSVVWDSRTVFIAPDSRGRRLAEENVAIQFFYLSHADPREVITALRSLIQSRQIAEIPRLNAVVIKETVVNLKTAQEVVERMDRADAKTVSDVGS
jgi:type II secretory pathway component GspD/PulD (secretin)